MDGYRKGQTVKAVEKKRTLKGVIVGIYEHFIRVQGKHYSECFSYIDIAIGEVKIEL